MSDWIAHVLFSLLLIGTMTVRTSEGVDSQMLTFLLNEMSNYRTASLAMENEITQLKSVVANLTSQNNQLQSLVASLNSQCRNCGQDVFNNVSRLHQDIQTIARSTNTSILYIDRERAVFEERIEKLLANHSTVINTQIQNLTHDVIFSVHGSPGDKLQFTGIKYSNVSIDTPPNYNVATGRYTVPEDGLYTLRITEGIFRWLNNQSPFIVDGVPQQGCYGNSASGASSVCQIYVYLHAGQNVWTQDSNYFVHTNTTVFSGWKM